MSARARRRPCDRLARTLWPRNLIIPRLADLAKRILITRVLVQVRAALLAPVLTTTGVGLTTTAGAVVGRDSCGLTITAQSRGSGELVPGARRIVGCGPL